MIGLVDLMVGGVLSIIVLIVFSLMLAETLVDIYYKHYNRCPLCTIMTYKELNEKLKNNEMINYEYVANLLYSEFDRDKCVKMIKKLHLYVYPHYSESFFDKEYVLKSDLIKLIKHKRVSDKKYFFKEIEASSLITD